MHAFLIVNRDKKMVEEEIVKITSRLKANPMEYNLSKIEDTRYLSTLTSLKIKNATAYILRNIDNATPEAQSAFLKNLEEPQERLYYILTAENISALLPTVVSRCQIIKTKNEKLKTKNESTLRFIKLTVGEKLAYIDKIKDREEAKNFVEDLVNILHSDLIGTSKNHQQIAKNLEVASVAFNNLKVNGNVSLQLTNMAINLN